MFSKIALKIYALKKLGIIKSSYDFWKNFSESKINEVSLDLGEFEKELQEINLICAFDEDFPKLLDSIKLSEKPFLFLYKGDITLLKNLKKNIAVIGQRTPNEEILKREEIIVTKLVQNGFNIVSGLALGCDTKAHRTCINLKGKTIATLPGTLNSIYPKQNKTLAEDVVQNGGLLLTEYAGEPKNKYESLKRFVERDRLQAMFSDTVILISSFRFGEGDSGSRHAMEKAKEYKKSRFVMFDAKKDCGKSDFGLNEDFAKVGEKVLTSKTLEELIS